jgi:predicted nuclease with TOPRIM domain
MKQSELDYKQETGLAASFDQRIIDDYEVVYNSEYIEWLEEKYDQSKKIKSDKELREDYEESLSVIESLQYELSEMEDKLGLAEDKMEDMKYEIKELTGDR